MKKSEITADLMKRWYLILVILIIWCGVPAASGFEPTWKYPLGGDTLGIPVISPENSEIIVPAGKIFVFSKNGSLQQSEPYGTEIAMTPDGKNLASSFASMVYFFKITPSEDNPTANRLEKMWQYDFPDQVRLIRISDDGALLLVATRSMGIYTIDTSTKEIASYDEEYNALISFFGDENSVLGISGNEIHIYNDELEPLDAYEISSVTVPSQMILLRNGEIIIFNDGQKIHCIDNTDNESELWSLSEPGIISAISGMTGNYPVIVGTDTGYIDSFGLNGERSWNYSSNPQNQQSSGITGLATDGNIITAGTFDGKIFWFDMNGTILGSYKGSDRIRHIAISPDGSLTVATGDEGIYAFSSSLLHFPIENNQSGTVALTPEETVPVSSQTQKESLPSVSTNIPSEYSVIKTPTRSPVSAIVIVLALISAMIVFTKRDS